MVVPFKQLLLQMLKLGHVFLTIIPRSRGDQWWIFTEPRSGLVNIQRWSRTLRGIIVLVFAQSVNRYAEFQF